MLPQFCRTYGRCEPSLVAWRSHTTVLAEVRWHESPTCHGLNGLGEPSDEDHRITHQSFSDPGASSAATCFAYLRECAVWSVASHHSASRHACRRHVTAADVASLSQPGVHPPPKLGIRRPRSARLSRSRHGLSRGSFRDVWVPDGAPAG